MQAVGGKDCCVAYACRSENHAVHRPVDLRLARSGSLQEVSTVVRRLETIHKVRPTRLHRCGTAASGQRQQSHSQHLRLTKPNRMRPEAHTLLAPCRQGYRKLQPACAWFHFEHLHSHSLGGALQSERTGCQHPLLSMPTRKPHTYIYIYIGLLVRSRHWRIIWAFGTPDAYRGGN
jgi:hypothetical protein